MGITPDKAGTSTHQESCRAAAADTCTGRTRRRRRRNKGNKNRIINTTTTATNVIIVCDNKNKRHHSKRATAQRKGVIERGKIQLVEKTNCISKSIALSWYRNYNWKREKVLVAHLYGNPII